MDERIGSLIDERYRISESMDSGSMGAVYKAERVPVGKLVAIKFLHASYSNDTEFLARFERETRVMSKLAHPNCVSVVDFGVWKGTPYLVMEYVAGRTLRKIIDGGALPALRALSIARQIVSGLAHAHAQGITHRDVKPANIMITEEIGTGEHVRILDFGLARLRGAVGRDATQANVVVGTPNYMAPEQTIGGGIIDERTDIYAVGIVLFEMLTGERPFHAEDTLTLLGMHRAAPVPQIADRVPADAELPAGLQPVIDRAMAKSPGDRFQTAIAFADAIDGMIGRPVAATGPRGYPVAKQVEPAAHAPTLVAADSRSAVATVITALRPARERTSSERTVADPPAIEPGFARSAPPARPARPARSPQPARPASGSRAGILLALIVLGGGAYAAYYVQNRAKVKPPSALEGGELAQGEPEQPDRGSGSGSGEAAGSGSGSGSGEPAAGSGSGSAATPDRAGSGSAGSDDPGAGSAAGSGDDPGAGSGSAAGSGAPLVAEPEPVPAPSEATNPDPVGPRRAEDEAENAPKTQAELEKRKPIAPVPALATTINGAVKLIQGGKRDLALASLQALEQKQPKSAYTAFLLGNLYFDQRWWSVAMDYYRAAIYRNGGYRTNAVLIRNVIDMLVSKKTDKQAEAFLRKAIGRPALPYLQSTAKTDPNAYLRKYAAALARQLR